MFAPQIPFHEYPRAGGLRLRSLRGSAQVEGRSNRFGRFYVLTAVGELVRALTPHSLARVVEDEVHAHFVFGRPAERDWAPHPPSVEDAVGGQPVPGLDREGLVAVDGLLEPIVPIFFPVQVAVVLSPPRVTVVQIVRPV